ncbi:heme-binding protein [Albimonas sp. CAU 1670]|uniref:SOUL family heme-binding protein n=1 Tax=Albimonas sp. CAU 1670 TaxID=3032599 RepID=UPI0023D9BFFB|nr:heme-binding protein [Albimonas sp. CAU 1670]MDF2235356.1 heme-binding protein [Albimonas sp. CAU 1670]
MRVRRVLTAGLAVAVAPLLAACAADERDIETPSYETVARLADDVEVRRYAPRLAAETVAEGGNAAFRRLFAYISGENAGGAEIAMTAPVETRTEGADIAMTAPVETAAAEDGGVRMRFFLPAAYDAATAPQPTDPRVRLVETPGRTEAVLRYSGLPLESRAETRKTRLLEIVSGSDWTAQGEAATYYYDPPWTLPWSRRNEVAVPVGPAGD